MKTQAEIENKLIGVNEMSDFLNLENGILTLNSYRLPNATVTDQEDLLKAFDNQSGETLTAIVENYDCL